MIVRTRWEVDFDKKAKSWFVKRGKQRQIEGITSKATAIDLASTELWRLHDTLGELSELVIKKKDHTIQDKRTYGKDPERHAG